MVVIQLPDDLHTYLQVVIKRYSAGGIDPEEGQALFYLNEFAIKKAQHIPDAEIQAADRANRQPKDDLTQGTNAAAPVAPTTFEPMNDGVRSLKRGDVDH